MPKESPYNGYGLRPTPMTSKTVTWGVLVLSDGSMMLEWVRGDEAGSIDLFRGIWRWDDPVPTEFAHLKPFEPENP